MFLLKCLSLDDSRTVGFSSEQDSGTQNPIFRGPKERIGDEFISKAVKDRRETLKLSRAIAKLRQNQKALKVLDSKLTMVLGHDIDMNRVVSLSE